MNPRGHFRVAAATAVVYLVVVPFLILGDSKGPDQRYTGAPGDNTCAVCHISSSPPSGKAVLSASSGTTYIPGQQQTLTLTISDSAAALYGFQISARAVNNLGLGQAGDFTPANQQIVLCDLGDLKPNAGVCPANELVQFIGHGSPVSSNTSTVTWTAPAGNIGPLTLYAAAVAANGDHLALGDRVYTTQLTLCPYLGCGQPLGFFTLAPCRMVDTRMPQIKSGPFGPPALGAYANRDFPLQSSGCAIPPAALAYSVNMTAVPFGPLDFLSAWPTGQPYPGVSTLNSPDGSVIANAAILQAGNSGSITVMSGQSTNMLMDINGYFAIPNGQELLFYPVTPCRIADTRAGQGQTGALGPPALAPYIGRDFPIQSSACGIPPSAKAYSLNMTAVPSGRLDFLSTWPSGQPYPGVSTLNSTDGSVIANAAIVPAGVNGAVTVVAGNATNLIIDTNGYFAPAGSTGGLHFYPLSPCRAVDTRNGQGKTGAFGPPAIGSYAPRDFPLLASSCNIPASAQAFALNITVVPQGPLSFLSTWPTGQGYPGVSTLNSPKGTVLANAAIVPAGTNGSITVLTSNPANVIIDVNGYFSH